MLREKNSVKRSCDHQIKSYVPIYAHVILCYEFCQLVSNDSFQKKMLIALSIEHDLIKVGLASISIYI